MKELRDNREIAVSITCTVYNHEKYLRKCLDGFVMQKTDFNFEVLIHDDASTDRSAEIIREYELKYPEIIKPIYQSENQYSKGVKIGIEYQYPRVRGRYLAFCEGDDYWCDENKLQSQFDIMEKNRDAVLCVHPVQYINEDGSLTSNIKPNPVGTSYKKNSDEFTAMLFEQSICPFQTSSFFIRYGKYEEILEKHPTFWDACDVGDVCILMSLASIGSVCYIDRIMSCYRMSSIGSWSSRTLNNKDAMKNHEQSIISTLRLYDEYRNNKFHEQIEKCIREREFRILEIDNDYHLMKEKKYESEFRKLSKKEGLYYKMQQEHPGAMNFYKNVIKGGGRPK